jgi:hypothetical protein
MRIPIAKQLFDKEVPAETFLVNILLLGYARILATEEVLSQWSLSCPLLGNGTVNMSIVIEGIFYAWSMQRVYREQQGSFANSRG